MQANRALRSTAPDKGADTLTRSAGGAVFRSGFSILAFSTLSSVGALLSQQPALPLPLAQGSTVVQTLWTPDTERESFLTAQEVSPERDQVDVELV